MNGSHCKPRPAAWYIVGMEDASTYQDVSSRLQQVIFVNRSALKGPVIVAVP